MDIMALYPIKSDIFTKLERVEPHYYNYCCIHGYQLYLRVVRPTSKSGMYQVLTASWFPRIGDPSTYVFTDRLHLVMESRSWDDILECYKKCAMELLHYIDYGKLRIE